MPTAKPKEATVRYGTVIAIQRGEPPDVPSLRAVDYRRDEEDTLMSGDYGSGEAAMKAYLRAGERRAQALGNRGPIRFTASGELHPEIVEAYWRCGFYVFEGVLKPDELVDIERDLHMIMDRLPVEKGAALDAKGRPALAA